MRKIRLSFIGLAALLLLAFAVQAAGHADAIKASLMDARTALLAMIDAPDRAAQDKYQAEITTASKGVDDAVDAALADSAGNPGTLYLFLPANRLPMKGNRYDVPLFPQWHASILSSFIHLKSGQTSTMWNSMIFCKDMVRDAKKTTTMRVTTNIN